MTVQPQGGGCLGLLLGLLTLMGAVLAGVFGFDGGVMDREEPSNYETPTAGVSATEIVESPTPASRDDEDRDLNETAEPTATSDLTFPPVAPETVTPGAQPSVPGLPVTPTPVLR